MAALSGLSFAAVVLPLMVAIFLLTPPRWRAAALLLLSFGYFFLAAPRYVILIAACIVTEWAGLLVMERFDDSPSVRKICLAFSVCKNMGIILWFEWLFSQRSILETPLGLQVFALSGIWCTLDVYRRKSPYLQNPLHLAVYCSFFPRLYQGPMLRYQDFAPQLETPSPTLAEMGHGFSLYLQGAVKVSILAGELHRIYLNLSAFPEAEISVLGVWAAMLVLALSVYYYLSGLSQIAISIAQMMGLTLPKNFYYPYQSRSVEDFSGRFLIGLVHFWRSLLPGEKSERRILQASRILAVGALMGLWFGLRANYILWGIFLALFVVAERFLYPNLLARTPTFFRRICTFLVILSSFALFSADSLAGALQTSQQMFGFGVANIATSRLGYVLLSNWLFLAVGILFSTSIISLAYGFLSKRLPKTAGVISGVSCAVMAAVLMIF